MTKTQKISDWLWRPEGTCKFGALKLSGMHPCVVHSYDVLIGVIELGAFSAHVNVGTYSVTSSGHRNRLLEALELGGYFVTEIPNESFLREILESIENASNG